MIQSKCLFPFRTKKEDKTIKSWIFGFQVIENSGYGADKFTMVRNNDGTGSLKIVQSLDYEDQLQSNGFRFRIQVNDKVSNEKKMYKKDDNFN